MVNTGVGVTIPTGNEIDGKYLVNDVQEIKKEINQWRNKFPQFGVTIMCDSWIGIARNSVINFLVYCNGTMYFWESIDVTGVIQDLAFILKVCALILLIYNFKAMNL